jgi:hypothetical protein
MEENEETKKLKVPEVGPLRHTRKNNRRWGFSIREAARALGMTPDALRRLVERHALREGDETVARLTGGITARKRVGMGRWLVQIPAELRS